MFKKKEGIKTTCKCIRCMYERLRNSTSCDKNEYREENLKIEIQIMAEYTNQNGHLAKNDPLRHECGNGVVEQSRFPVLIQGHFCVSTPNPSAPLPYLKINGGVVYPFGQPLQLGEVRNDIKFRKSFKTPEGMTIPNYRRLIEDFQLNHEMIGTYSFAFPRHMALAMASQSSTCCVLEKSGIHFEHGFITTKRFHDAKIYLHDKFQITRFTDMSGLQKDMVLAHSGIAGILISRLFNPEWYLVQQHKQTYKNHVKYQQFSTNYLHSKKECEIFADNRYGEMVRKNEETIVYENIPIEKALEETRALYRITMPNIMDRIQKFKRGFLNLDDIHSKEFRQLILLWSYCVKKRMLLQKTFPEETRISCINKLMEIAAEFPLLYSTEMLKVYSQNHLLLVKKSIDLCLYFSSNAKTIDLVTDSAVGCRSAFLAFAAIEPRMVDEYLAPRLAICGYDGNDRQEAHDNHIPSRCPIFGKLVQKYRDHMPRTGDCQWDICRKNGGAIKSYIEYVNPWKLKELENQ